MWANLSREPKNITVNIPVNDNTEHPLLKDFYIWQFKADGERRYPKCLLHCKFRSRERHLANLIWFYQFDINNKKQHREEVKSKLKVIK